MNNTTTPLMQELDRRTGDGLDIRLMWSKHDGRVHVEVTDARTGDAFTVEVRQGESAAKVFQHPFAYAGRRSTAPAGATA